MKKFSLNQVRDELAQKTLIASGWHVATIWECETKNIESLNNAIDQILRKLSIKRDQSAPQSA